MKKAILKVLVFPFLLALIVGTLSFQPTPASAHHSSNFTNFPTISSGSANGYVKFLQAYLDQRYYSPGPIDGIFGSKTRTAVINFQKDNGLVADGIVGSKTWSKIRASFTNSSGILKYNTGYRIIEINTSSDYWQYRPSESGSGGLIISSGYLK